MTSASSLEPRDPTRPRTRRALISLSTRRSPATNRATPHFPRQSPNPATKTWRPKEAGWHGRPDQNLHPSRLSCCAWAIPPAEWQSAAASGQQAGLWRLVRSRPACAWAKHTAHGLLPQTRIQILAGGVTVGQFANCPTVSESGRDANGKQRAGPDPSAEGQAAADAGEAGLRGYGEPKRSVDSRRQLPEADDFPALPAVVFWANLASLD